jgi:hypothetical protein
VPIASALEPFDFDSFGSYRRENKQAIKKSQTIAEMEVRVDRVRVLISTSRVNYVFVFFQGYFTRTRIESNYETTNDDNASNDNNESGRCGSRVASTSVRTM